MICISRQIRFAGAALVLSMLLAASPGCVGYQMGGATLFRPDIRTVHVPIFENETYRRYLGELLTEAIVKEIETQTPYKVVGPVGADSVLRGRIVSINKRPVAVEANGNPREILLDFIVEATWLDSRGAPIAAQMQLPLTLASVSSLRSPSFIPETGQSVATAEQDAALGVAQQIVSRMEIIW